ncbi:MAG: 4-hydroxythreonine-4-phosphate dehydrogenase PdxA [Rhodospirillales bacterium]|nr:4-hydroxythreonine-4-phosphate dehydrogenase PdxA [Rhodospirillales bacterium]
MSSSQRTSTFNPLAVTMGEPSGIGGEITLKSWLQRRDETPTFVVLDSPARLERLASTLGLPVPVREISDPTEAMDLFPSALPVLNLGVEVPFDLGVPDPENSAAVCRSIEMAVSLTLKGHVQGIVTNPIQKKTLYDAGFDFPGHTEFIAHLTGEHSPVMMLAGPGLRVVPITVHQSLASAIAGINKDTITACVRATALALHHDLAIEKPRIAMAGLNPHAGEDGALGHEEADIIEPAIRILKDEGFDIFGPVPPDALFTPRARQGYDVAMCHYHDQALIPIKALAVDDAVNITLGLSVVRTSPDHGTALDIADKGIADPQSLICALQMAETIARNRLACRGTS